ncbi:uncharacterized protein DSM5745_03015 [Aspergillus mulundensis]|uniref:HAT C-terminal dimerisation domain-containing protein n=1 Tax=Aspergillus mulundensis TaxID=1810919 RepID=A0A3D8SJ86_9EURO|nr:hypothetical protein DSM5745_03015 [Aspergillus mulundensis]RDW86373.1 hypothetical protein DSM5745_03015 [Aspergillus mulundensis]
MTRIQDNIWVRNAYKLFYTEDGKRRVQCRQCGEERDPQITRQREHLLDKCPKRPRHPRSSQSTLNWNGAIQQEDQELLCMAVYTGGLPFSVYETPELRSLLRRHNITPPTRQALSNELLDKYYNQYKVDVNRQLKDTKFLNVTIDKTTDQSLKRVISLSFNTPTRSFFYTLEEITVGAFGTEETARWIHQTLKNYLAKAEYSHVFFIGCDSHGLQLLMKDLLSLGEIKEVFKNAASVISYFRNSPKQLAWIHHYQRRKEGKVRTLIASAITRWGTQFNALRSVWRSGVALRQWTLTPEVIKASKSNNKETAAMSGVATIINSSEFWTDLENLLCLLEPIHRMQIESEHQKANIMTVMERWLQIRSILSESAEETPYKADLQEYLAEAPYAGFKRRFGKQVTPLHWAAYYLNPRNVSASLDEPVADVIREVFSTFTTEEAHDEFALYRAKKAQFFPADLWKTEDPLVFWAQFHDTAPSLSHLAIRLVYTTANSVSAERAFSAINNTKDKRRSRLQVKKVNKLVYLYMNTRALDSTPTPPPTNGRTSRDIKYEFTQLAEEEDEMARNWLFHKNLQIERLLSNEDTIVFGGEVTTKRKKKTPSAAPQAAKRPRPSAADAMCEADGFN